MALKLNKKQTKKDKVSLYYTVNLNKNTQLTQLKYLKNT